MKKVERDSQMEGLLSVTKLQCRSNGIGDRDTMIESCTCSWGGRDGTPEFGEMLL